MDRLNRILVPIDFSPCSTDALRQAFRLAARSGAQVLAMHVLDFWGPVPDPAMGVWYPNVPIEDLTGWAHRQWSTFAPECQNTPAVFKVEVGGARDRILEAVRREKPDLLVMGAHSTEDRARAIGATAAACVQRADTRVMVVRQGQNDRFRSVAVCVDFSEASRAALNQAVWIAAEDDAQLHVLHVFADPWHGRDKPKEVCNVMPDFDAKFERAVQDRLRAFCQPMAHELTALRAEYHASKARTHAAGIIAFAQRKGCDLMVLGTRGKWNLRDFFWGSTAERVVRECPCSILAIKPPGFVQEHGSGLLTSS